ncbi:hypothetical protein BKA57DRAFT_521286 [Linnemannia elongata]|nr:hypothetical protein BKA57DRAFT_521286 [Linnemannia elongata]
MTHGSTGINIMETDISNPREAPILAENMIDFAWDNLAEAIMDVALETLPRKRVGKQSMVYRTNVQNGRRGRCHGELLRLSHVWFVNPNCPPQSKKRRQMVAHETIFKVWNNVKTDLPETRIAEPPELQAERIEWEQWRNTVKNEWNEQQRIRRNEERKQKTKDIAEAIERRDMRFLTNTKSTIQSILETNRSHATLDRVKITVDDRISISDHPSDILTNVRLYFEKWHGPRQSKGIPKGSLWEQIYQPAEYVEAGYESLCPIPKDTLQWTEGVIFCLSKTNPSTGSLADVRPITLLEHGRKILFSILTERLSTIMLEHDILKGANFSVLKGTSTADPIHALNAVMETQDNTRRRSGSYSRICVGATIRPRRRRGMSTPVEDSIRPPTVCHRLIGNGAHNVDTAGPGKGSTHVSDLAFVDDTSLVGPGHTELTRMTDASTEFFGMHGIEINGKKTELLAINPTHIDNINYGGSLIQPQAASKASRVLEVWLTADGSAKTTAAMAMKETETVCGILLRKSVTDKQCIYIINAVLIPRLPYRMRAQIPAWTVIERITKKYRTVVRQKLGLPSSTPSSILHHTRLYGLRDLKDALAEQHISTMHLRSTQKGLIGDLTHCRLQDLQRAASLRESPLSNLAIASTYTQHNLIARVCQLMVERDVNLCDVSAKEGERVLLSKVVTTEIYVKHSKWMERGKVFYLEDIINEDRSHTRPRKEVARTHGIKGDRVWFAAMCQAVSEFPQIEMNRVEEREEENQRHACETQEDAEEEEAVLWEFGSEDEEEPPIRREKEVRDKLRQQAAKEAAEEEKRRKKTEKRAELDRRRQELERALPPKRRLMRAVKARLKELETEAYPLLLAIKERIQHHATSNTPKHSYNHIIMDEATQSAMEEQRKHTQPGPELMELIAGIIATPQDQDVCIRLGNQKVVKMFNDIVVNRRRASVRAKLRCDYAVEWAIVAGICSERIGSATVEWVKGDRGDKWNVAADKAVKEAQAVVGKEWEVRAEDQDDLRYTAKMAGTTLEIDTRQALKMQTTRWWHQTWRSLKRHKRSIQDYDGTDWLESKEAHDEIWKDGLGRIDFWGAIATKHYNRERKKRRKEGETKPKEIEWVAVSVRACKVALRRIIQWPSTEDRHEGYTDDEKWTVCHILRGLVPKALTTEWAKVFKEMPKSVAEHVSRLFCKFIEKEGREKIWKPRCERTVEWEKQQVSQKDGSTNPRRSGRGPNGNKYMDGNPERMHASAGGPWRSTRRDDALTFRMIHMQPTER